MSAPKRRRADDEVSDTSSVLTCDTASSVDLEQVADIDEIIEDAWNDVPAALAAGVMATLVTWTASSSASARRERTQNVNVPPRSSRIPLPLLVSVVLGSEVWVLR